MAGSPQTGRSDGTVQTGLSVWTRQTCFPVPASMQYTIPVLSNTEACALLTNTRFPTTAGEEERSATRASGSLNDQATAFCTGLGEGAAAPVRERLARN